MGQLGLQAYTGGLFHAVALAEFDKEMSQTRRHVTKNEIFDAALDFPQPQPDKLSELHSHVRMHR